MSRVICSTLIILVLLAVVAISQDSRLTQPVEETATSKLTADVEICTDVVDRACTGSAPAFDANVGKLYCWSRISGMTDETTIRHIWLYSGKTVLEVPLTIKGNHWRTWSCKNISASMTGDWEVRIIDASGSNIASTVFTVGDKK